MTSLHPDFVQRLRRGQFVRFEHPCQLRLAAEQGALWVTVDGEPDDIQIDAGTSRTFDGDCAVLVGTFRGDAVLSATTPPPAPSWRAWLGWALSRAVVRSAPHGGRARGARVHP